MGGLHVPSVGVGPISLPSQWNSGLQPSELQGAPASPNTRQVPAWFMNASHQNAGLHWTVVVTPLLVTVPQVAPRPTPFLQVPVPPRSHQRLSWPQLGSPLMQNTMS